MGWAINVSSAVWVRKILPQSRSQGRSDYQGRAATLGLAHSFYDRRDSLGLVYRFSYRQVLAHRLRLVVAQQLRHGA